MNEQKSNRGFKAMDPAIQKQIASLGGKSVDPSRRSFSQNFQLAREAGRKGGKSVAPDKRSFSKNRALAAAAGRKGGLSVSPEKRSFSRNPELARQAGRMGKGKKKKRKNVSELCAALAQGNVHENHS